MLISIYYTNNYKNTFLMYTELKCIKSQPKKDVTLWTLIVPGVIIVCRVIKLFSNASIFSYSRSHLGILVFATAAIVSTYIWCPIFLPTLPERLLMDSMMKKRAI